MFMRNTLLSFVWIDLVNEHLHFFGLPPLPLQTGLFSGFNAVQREMNKAQPLLRIFRVVNNWDNHSVRETLWRKYFNLEDAADFTYHVTFAFLDISMLQFLSPALKSVCHLVSGSSARARKFLVACRKPPLLADDFFDLFSSPERIELMQLLVAGAEQEVISSFFYITVQMIACEFNYSPSEEVEIRDCSVC